MASNVITAVIPKILAQGLLVLRQNAITPRIVASMSSIIAGQKGSTIDVPIPSAITAVSVTPAATAPAAGAFSPTTVAVTLDQWYEAAFDLSDNEYEQAMNGIVPMAVDSAIKAIVNQVDQHILSLYKKFYSYVGTAGTTPFGGSVLIADAINARTALNTNLAPMDPRHVVLDPLAEGNALTLAQFADSTFSGSVEAMRDGKLNMKLGAQWWMNQNVRYHTTTTTAGAVTANGVNAVGATTISLAKAAGASMSALEGDIFTIAGDTQTYVITAAVTIVHTANTSVTIQPPLAIATAGSEAVTFKASHRANLMMHRDAIAFASRPLMPAAEGLGTLSLAQMDPISGLTLRVEVTREFKRTRWSFDFLWGASVVRRELGCVIAG